MSRPSDRAIAQAFWNLVETEHAFMQGFKSHQLKVLDGIAERAQLIDLDAAAPEGECPNCGHRDVSDTELDSAISLIADFNPGADEFTEALEVLRFGLSKIDAARAAGGDGNA